MSGCSSCSSGTAANKKVELAPNILLKRRITQTSFFILFIIAPIFDIFRLDLTLGHFIFFGQNWTLGLDALMTGEGTALDAAVKIITRAFFPLLAVFILFAWTSWKYGRLYCGWLCPHFSVVEMVNALIRKASGKFSFWDRTKLSKQTPDGKVHEENKNYWWLVFIAVAGFSFLWAVVFLTYLLPPKEIYYNLLHLSLTRNQMLFIGVATFLLTIEFMFARHLFCRFACAVGVFQSLVWMGNKRAMVVSFERQRAADCHGCKHACEDACPMRLKPRSIKRHMFTCTECARCLVACEQVQDKKGLPSLLTWQAGQSALQESDR